MITIAEIKHQEKLVGRHYGAIRRLSKPDSDKVLRQKAARAFQEAFRFSIISTGARPHIRLLYISGFRPENWTRSKKPCVFWKQIPVAWRPDTSS